MQLQVQHFFLAFGVWLYQPFPKIRQENLDKPKTNMEYLMYSNPNAGEISPVHSGNMAGIDQPEQSDMKWALLIL